MPKPIPDQVPPSPFEILGLKEEEAPDEPTILDAYARRASRSNNEIELGTELQWARLVALYLHDWSRSLSGDSRENVPCHPEALSAEELGSQITEAAPIDLERFRRTPRRTIQEAVSSCVWHRSAWNDLVQSQSPEAIAELLSVRAEELVLADDADQLLYELQSEGIAHLTEKSFLVQRAATSALVYLAWTKPEEALQLAPKLIHGLVDDRDGMSRVPNTAILADMALQGSATDRDLSALRRGTIEGMKDLGEKSASAIAAFLDLLRKAPALSHELSGPLLHRVAADIAEAPTLYFTLLFHRRMANPAESEVLDLDWRDFDPGAHSFLAHYIPLAMEHLAVPILPGHIVETTDFPELSRRANLAFTWLTKLSPSAKKSRRKKLLWLGLPATLLAAAGATHLLPVAWAVSGAGTLAGIGAASFYYDHHKIKRAAQAAVTALTAARNILPSNILKAQLWLMTAQEEGPMPAWLMPPLLPDDPLAMSMEAWNVLVTLTARWLPPEDTAE